MDFDFDIDLDFKTVIFIIGSIFLLIIFFWKILPAIQQLIDNYILIRLILMNDLFLLKP